MLYVGSKGVEANIVEAHDGQILRAMRHEEGDGESDLWRGVAVGR